MGTTYRYWLWYNYDMDYKDVHSTSVYIPERFERAVLHVDVDPNVPGLAHGCMGSIKVNGVEVARWSCNMPNCDVWEGDVTKLISPKEENYVSVEVCVNIALIPLFIPLGGLTAWLDVTYPEGVSVPKPPGPEQEVECKIFDLIPVGKLPQETCAALNVAATIAIFGIGLALLIKLLKS